jgi:hypothetical protein
VCPGPPASPLLHPVVSAAWHGSAAHSAPPAPAVLGPVPASHDRYQARPLLPLPATLCSSPPGPLPSPASPHLCLKKAPATDLAPLSLRFLSGPEHWQPGSPPVLKLASPPTLSPGEPGISCHHFQIGATPSPLCYPYSRRRLQEFIGAASPFPPRHR